MSRSRAVKLSMAEFMTAASIGMRRQVQNVHKGRQDRHGCSMADGWGPHIEGACGECAVAKLFGLYWSGAMGDLNADDVGLLQVRTTSRATNRLIIHPDDPDERPFVLVTGLAPDFMVVGWILGRDAKRQDWWRDPAGGRPAYFVEQADLKPIGELLSIIWKNKVIE